MEQILQYIINNKDMIFDVALIIVGIFVIGRKRAMNFVMNHLGDSKEEVFKNIDEHAPVLAKYIYAKLPKSAKLFISAKVIEKAIHKFVATLDKK